MWLTRLAHQPFGKTGLVVRLGGTQSESWSPRGRTSTVSFGGVVAGAPSDAACAEHLLQHAKAAGGQVTVTVIVESVYAPVALLDIGLVPLNESTVKAHATRRLQETYRRGSYDRADWIVRLDWIAGERYGLAYALDNRLVEVLRNALRGENIRLNAIFPAFAWGLDRLRPWKQWTGGSGWWVWREQDRQLVARLDGNRVVALHPALPLVSEPETLRRQTQIEARRQGGAGAAFPTAVGGWQFTASERSLASSDLAMLQVFQDVMPVVKTAAARKVVEP